MQLQSQDYKQQVIEIAHALINSKLQKEGKYIPDDKPPVYVIYARKSTTGNKKDKNGRNVERQERSIPDQIKDCHKLAGDLGLSVVQVFREEKSARKSANREVFDDMMDGIRTKKYSGIISWHPDRLGRNMKDAGEIIDLIDRGVIKDLKFPQYTFQVGHVDKNQILAIFHQFLAFHTSKLMP